LWGVPSLPECTASWPSRPYTQVRPVRLTAFPGVPIRFPDSATLAAWSEPNSTGASNPGQGSETAGQRPYAQVDRYGTRVTIGVLSANLLVSDPARLRRPCGSLLVEHFTVYGEHVRGSGVPREPEGTDHGCVAHPSGTHRVGDDPEHPVGVIGGI